MPSNGRRIWVLWGTLALASFLIRLFAASWWQSRLGGPDVFAFGDSHSYWVLGLAISRGDPFQYGGGQARIMRMPGYPLILGMVFLIWGGEPPVFWARAAGSILGVFAVLGVAWMARSWFGPIAGWCSGGLAAIYPGAIAMSVFVLSEALFTPLLIGQIFCWAGALRCDATSSARWWFLLALGGFSGLAVMSRPSWLLFPIFATMFCAVFDRFRFRDHLRTGGFALVVMCLIMAPWWWRSYHITGHFVLTTLEMGASLYDGLNPQADGGSNMDFKRSFYDQQTRDTPEMDQGQYAYLVDRRMKRAAWQWARENPLRTAELALEKVKRLWRPWPNTGAFRSDMMRWMVAAGFLPLLLLALWEGWRRFESERALVLLVAAPAIYVTALHLVFVSSIRYRQPPMMVAIVLAGAGLERVIRKYLIPTQATPEAPTGN